MVSDEGGGNQTEFRGNRRPCTDCWQQRKPTTALVRGFRIYVVSSLTLGYRSVLESGSRMFLRNIRPQPEKGHILWQSSRNIRLWHHTDCPIQTWFTFRAIVYWIIAVDTYTDGSITTASKTVGEGWAVIIADAYFSYCRWYCEERRKCHINSHGWIICFNLCFYSTLLDEGRLFNIVQYFSTDPCSNKEWNLIFPTENIGL